MNTTIPILMNVKQNSHIEVKFYRNFYSHYTSGFILVKNLLIRNIIRNYNFSRPNEPNPLPIPVCPYITSTNAKEIYEY